MSDKKVVFEKGIDAPDFSLQGNDGKVYTLSDYRIV